MGISLNPFTGQLDLVGSGGGGGAVSSVNSQTGAVVLTATDVDAANRTLSNLVSPTNINIDLTFALTGTSQYYGLGWVPGISGNYPITITPSVGSPFIFNYISISSDFFAEDNNFVAAFNIDSTVIANGFRAYNFDTQGGEPLSVTGTNQFILVGPPSITYTVMIGGNGSLVDVSGSVFLAVSFNAPLNTVINVRDPLDAQEVATKNYVDTNSVNSSLSNLTSPTDINQDLNLSGNSITGVAEINNVGFTPVVSFTASATTVHIFTDAPHNNEIEVTNIGNDLPQNTAIVFSGADIPAPLIVGTTYYSSGGFVGTGLGADSIQVWDAPNGLVIDLTTTGSGLVTISTSANSAILIGSDLDLNTTGIITTTDSAVVDGVATNPILISTGDKTAGTGNSGNVSVTTGTSAGGTRGDIFLDSNKTHITNNLVGGTGTTIASTATNSIAFGEATGTGLVQVTGSSVGSFALGRANNTSNIEASSSTSIAFGKSFSGGIIKAQQNGAIALGYTEGGTILANGEGSIAFGRSFNVGSSINTTSGVGSLAGGRVDTIGIIRAPGQGAVALGRADAGGILESNSTSMVFGYSTGASSNHSSTGDGSITTAMLSSGASFVSSASGSIGALHGTASSGSASMTGQGNILIGTDALGGMKVHGSGNAAFGTDQNAGVSGTPHNYGLIAGRGHRTSADYQTGLGIFSDLTSTNTTLAVGNGTSDGARSNLIEVNTTGFLKVNGDVLINTVGDGLAIKTGSNAKLGTAVLVAGTVTVSNTSVTANSLIFLTSQVDGGVVGFLRITALTAATSFVITSSNALDTSTVAYHIIESIP